MSFGAELKRRNVYKVGAAYAVVAWLVLQVADTLLPTFAAPRWVMPVFSAFVILGFPIALVLAWAFELTPEGIKPTASVAHGQSVAQVTGRRLNYAIVGLLALAVAYMFVDNYVLTGPRSDEAAASAARVNDSASATQRTVAANSVAVLPFQNMSPNADDAYFAAGMYEEVLNQLAKLKKLNVISRTTMMRYQDSGLSVPEIARQLNVHAVLEGSVRYAGNRVRITAQLIDADTDQHIWSDAYDRDLADVFAIQSDIAMNIANALLVQFTPDEQSLIERVPTQSPEAYALFLRALEVDDIDESIRLFGRATEIDPQFAYAYARLADRYAFAVTNSDGGSAVPIDERNELEARSRQAAQRALSIDPNLAEAYLALGRMAMLRWHWSEALANFERARDLAPQVTFSGHEVMVLSALGRHDDALAIAEQGLAREPDNPNANWYGYALGWARQYDAAADVFERTLRRAPRYLTGRDWLAFIENARGNGDAAVAQLEFSERLAGDRRLIVFLPEWAYNYARAGRPEDARRVFEEIERAAAAGGIPGAGGWAMAHLAIGDQAGALDWLQKAADKIASHEPDEGFFQLVNLKLNITNDPVLRQPEFVAVLNRIGGD